MSPGPHVFGDRRLGCWIVNVQNLTTARMDGLRALGVTDLFVQGGQGTVEVKQAVLRKFTGCHAWWAVDGLPVAEYVARALADIARWNPGAGDLNIEVPDQVLGPYMRQSVIGIRMVRRNYRLRLNIAPRKFGYVPVDLLQEDINLYVAIQNYGGNMDAMFSEADQERGLREAGVPDEKISTCYAGGCTVGGITGGQRVNTFPTAFQVQRGVIFTDDLLAQVGLI